MRSFPALLLFVVCPYVSAAVLDVGQITLTGSGTFKSPVQDAMIALSFSAYGSNGTDWISINASFFQFWNDGGGFLSDVEYPDLAIGRTFAFGVGDIEQCTVGDFFLIDVCGVSIDGISGYGSFTGVGGGGGLVQVFARPDGPFGSIVGPLLAQAEVTSNPVITGIIYSGPPNEPADSFRGTFDLQLPEPATGITGLIGIAALACLHRRRMVAKLKN